MRPMSLLRERMAWSASSRVAGGVHSTTGRRSVLRFSIPSLLPPGSAKDTGPVGCGFAATLPDDSRGDAPSTTPCYHRPAPPARSTFPAPRPSEAPQVHRKDGGARMVRDYELMYIVRPDVDEDGLRAAIDSVRSLIEGQGGEIRKTTNWGKRRLAYEVKHLRDGHYVIVEMRLDGGRVAEIERALRIHDSVFRHLLVIQEEPSADTGEGEEIEGGESGIPAPPTDGDVDAPQAAAEEDVPPAETEDDEEADEAEPAAVGAED